MPLAVSQRTLCLSGLAASLAVGAAALFSYAATPAAVASPQADPKAVEFFEKQVKPILDTHCVKCHGGEKTKGGLKLTSRADLMHGGETGPAVVLGAPAKGLLL